MSPSQPRKLSPTARILVVKFNAIGDLILSTPALRDLRKAYPRAHITLMVGSWSAPVIRHNPHVDEILEFDQDIFLQRRWRDLLRLLFDVRRRRFDAALIFHALPAIHLFMRLTGIPARFGMSRGKSAGLLTAAVPESLDPGTYYATKYQQVTALAGAPMGSSDPEVHSTEADEAVVRDLLAAEGLGSGRPFLLVAPGGGRNPVTDMPAKRWPVEQFAATLRELAQARPELKIVLSGAPSDREETGSLAKEIPSAVDWTGKLTLPQLFVAARSARAILCNDSSVLHVGVACGTPTVVPFGPTDARQLVPARGLRYVWQSPISCSPCYRVGSGAPFAGCPIRFRCMRETTTEQIRPLLELALARPD